MMLIIVALLPGLSNLQILSNDTNFLFSLVDHIRTEELQGLVGMSRS